MIKRVGALALAALLAGTAPAFASPKSELCTFVQTLSDKGAGAGIAYLQDMARVWSIESRQKIKTAIGGQVEKFNYSGGQIYQILDLPGGAAEYFLVLDRKGYPTPVYARVIFEGSGAPDSLNFINFDFNSNLEEITQRPFAQPPVTVDCKTAQ